MGAENSKPASDVSQHVFSADAPVRFSSGLVESLQKNTTTDSTRAKQQELAYQQRLTAELERLRAQELQNFTTVSENLSAEAENPAPHEPSLTEKLSDATSSSATLAEKQRHKDMTRDIVTREIEALKTKLEARRRMTPEQLDPALSKAKEDVVTCLRLNDRRPLDCWQEVENFKREVDRQARQFVEKTLP